MLTIHGVYKDGRIILLDKDRPPNDCQVVITFLTDEENDKLRAKVMLTPHQRKLLKLAQKGLHCRLIARALKISYGTARGELSAVYKKLGAKNSADAVNKAIVLGLLKPRSSKGILAASGNQGVTYRPQA